MQNINQPKRVERTTPIIAICATPQFIVDDIVANSDNSVLNKLRQQFAMYDSIDVIFMFAKQDDLVNVFMLDGDIGQAFAENKSKIIYDTCAKLGIRTVNAFFKRSIIPSFAADSITSEKTQLGYVLTTADEAYANVYAAIQKLLISVVSAERILQIK